MAHPSPLRQSHIDAGASLLPYGPPDTDIELAETFDALELEYAALRRRCVLADRPDRAIVSVVGTDRIGILNNMLTQELKDITPGAVRQSFWLNRRGKIEADIRLLHFEDRTLLELDAHAAAATVRSITEFIFAEDCELRDDTQSFHCLQLVGPTGPDLIELVAGRSAPDDGCACVLTLGSTDVYADRSDRMGVPVISLNVPADRAADVHTHLLAEGSPVGLDAVGSEDGHVEDDGSPSARIRLRSAGWHALNIARIEAGLPAFMLDFAPNNVPGETGILHDRVSFTKGCYLGQEVVARMNAVGNPKQIVVGLTCEKRTLSPERSDPVHPVTGSHVFRRGDAGRPVGAVTSATLSPSMGNVPICFAVVRWGLHEPGTELTIQAEGLELDARVHDGLRFV
ncbi:MAG: glycine cleavage T C-terminal barrel domain-containing protein [Planctomycetota bacterium]